MPQQLPNLDFTYNWNGKLWNNNFTTIRLANPVKYYVGKQFVCRLVHKQKDRPPDILQNVEIVSIKGLTIPKINDWIARLDTGYPEAEAQNLIRTMYKYRVADIETHPLFLIMLSVIK
jgi:hypothetical protein